MGDYGIYKGANYGFDKEESFEPLIPAKYRIQPGQFGITTDPRSANQLKEVSDKLNTGAKTIEISGISTEVLESIPDQHLREIARLKRLAGADITFHGPLVEPTGFNQQGSWEESSREQAEKQIWDAVKRGQQMMMTNVSDFEKGNKATYENGNLVVTLHTSNGLFNPKVQMKDKEGNVETKSIAVIDEYSGKAGYLPIEEDAFEGKTGKNKPTPEQEIERLNRKVWLSNLHNISIEARRGQNNIRSSLSEEVVSGEDSEFAGLPKNEKVEELDKVKQFYKLYKEDRKEYEKAINDTSNPLFKMKKPEVEERIALLAHGEMATRDSYDQMKEMFNKAKEALERQKNDPKAQDALKKLEEYREEIAPKIKEYVDNPLKLDQFAEDVSKGIRVLSTLPISPPQYRKVEEFAVEKAAQTFAGVAAKAYKEFGENAPILSLENPPVGMGLSRADEIKKLVVATREELSRNLQFDQGLDKKQADKAAEKLVGVTWDVGHINMVKKYGFDDSDLVKETKTIEPYLKHVHLSDNFGLEHTELPMGMGNVPMKEHLEVIGDKMKKMKAIIETGGHWYQDFKTSPLPESLAAFGSPIYPMQMQPYWDRAQAQVGSYFSGYGFNPDVHHSIYGSGFAGLPTELGGSIQGRNRLSGSPMD